MKICLTMDGAAISYMALSLCGCDDKSGKGRGAKGIKQNFFFSETISCVFLAV